jgi:2-polyprenyl-3-methyl-5-hydroxy-6-metoxy-1,4-benzoquinol methylase
MRLATLRRSPEDGRMTPETEANRQLWDQWADLHFSSEFYGVERFLLGGLSLPSCDIEAVGPVTGLSLLHLQCHFGMDTLSWARLGAKVTGLDFSERAIGRARELASECGLEAKFVCADVYRTPEEIGEHFDRVVTTAGVLPWLPNVRAWAQVVARMLRPGGMFYLREFHPVPQVLDEASSDPGAPVLRYPYFPTGEVICSGATGSYAVPQSTLETVSYEWPHTVAEVVQALLDAGLRLQAIREFPFTTYPALPWLEKGKDGNWRWPGEKSFLPLMYSLKATKPD